MNSQSRTRGFSHYKFCTAQKAKTDIINLCDLHRNR
uniref:Uncharacterized protein n=1 Tax=Arundo donax TaxID=35708 RepID=A0A0A9D1W6_ARUDO